MSSCNASCLNTVTSIDELRAHEILQLLMTVVLPPLSTTLPHAGEVPAVETSIPQQHQPPEQVEATCSARKCYRRHYRQ